ncbi:hypothetical protein NUW58_g6703 [Xylaria curta]|uniref:Uncharacterized protein n=1 Tax=Xylaria curta TaxID=42375 RepID=A0ACC1NRF9_9PEZI|nr:hypothetical protein NUW58_g6703 [Xylaria curta]
MAEQGINTLNDFYNYIDNFVKWVPFEGPGGREIYKKLCAFYFVFGQPTVYTLQTPIKPETAAGPLSWLSDWLVRYARDMGSFLDTPESFTEASRASFFGADIYRMGDYEEPAGGWKTFNQFFARHTKPGYRPIASPEKPDIIVSPADSTYEAEWLVGSDSIVNIKGLNWSIIELLNDTKYSHEFRDGIFMHSFLNTNDYHRLHAPIGGTVLEAKVIPGQVYLEVVVSQNGTLQPVRTIDQDHKKQPRDLDAPNTAGYQFCQARGLVVLDTAIGLVAVLPIGMAQVSSVVLTAEVNETLAKGEELAYFQFGGSDIVLVFESRSKVDITAVSKQHYFVGAEIGTASLLPTPTPEPGK